MKTLLFTLLLSISAFGATQKITGTYANLFDVSFDDIQSLEECEEAGGELIVSEVEGSVCRAERGTVVKVSKAGLVSIEVTNENQVPNLCTFSGKGSQTGKKFVAKSGRCTITLLQDEKDPGTLEIKASNACNSYCGSGVSFNGVVTK